MLKFDRKQQNSVKQLSFNEKIIFLKKKKKETTHGLNQDWIVCGVTGHIKRKPQFLSFTRKLLTRN